MTTKEIEAYLDTANIKLDLVVKEEILRLKEQAVKNQNEDQANYLWCLQQVYKIQHSYLTAFEKMKVAKFEDAWILLDRADIELSFLEVNYNKSFIGSVGTKFYLGFILNTIKQYQKLFPYKYFFSREAIVKEEKCSICGEIISLRHGCNHRLGQLYMGEQCCHKVTDIEFLGFAIVTDPFDKYSMLHIPEQKYNYYPLEELMKVLQTPFDIWCVDELNIVSPEYENISRNDLCPCGSGKKFKKCCMGTKQIYTKHYRINIANRESRSIKPLTFYNTWKKMHSDVQY
ncbi:MAG: SEC-C domain-containing protein [Lachnospiraceae bacterium]|nr:SEC-C domain-containing protein [Lachnospiraceae bacterium]